MAVDWSQFEIEGQAQPVSAGGFDASIFELETAAPQPYDPLGADASPAVAAARAGVGAASRFLPWGDEIIAAGTAGVDALRSLGSRPEGMGMFDALAQSFNQNYDRRAAEVRDYQQGAREQSGLATGVVDVAGALALPSPNLIGKATTIGGKALGGMAEGLGFGALYGSGEGKNLEERIAKGLEAAQTGAKWGAGIGGAVGAFQKAAPTLAESAMKLRRKAMGARSTDYSKSLEDAGIWDIIDDSVESATKGALDDLLVKGEIGKTARPDFNLASAITAQDDLSKQVGKIIQDYDMSGKPPVYPNFQKALDYLTQGKVPANEVDKYVAELIELSDGIKREGGGALSYLQQQKIAVGQRYEVGNEARNGFYKSLYHDIQRTIEKAAPEVAPLNRELTKWKIVAPILRRTAGADEASSLIDKTMQALRTSGGTLTTPILTGAALGGTMGGPGGAVLGGALTAAATPGGRNAIGKGISSLAESAAGAGNAADAVIPYLGLATSARESLPERGAGSPRQQMPLKAKGSSPNSLAESAQKQVSYRDIPANLSDAVQFVESRGREDAVSPKGAIGTHQVMPIAARDVLRSQGVDDRQFTDAQLTALLKKPGMSKQFGEAYLALLLDRYDGNLELALAAYNGGPSRLDRRGKDIARMPEETRNYVPAVTRRLGRA